MKTVHGDQINQVLQTVRRLSDDGDIQISILAYAFVTACRSCKADTSLALSQIEKMFDSHDVELFPLDAGARN